MKLCLFVVGILAALVLVACEPPEEMKKMFQECRKEAGLPEERPEGPPNADDPKMKCFHACLHKKKGDMVNGKIAPEKAIEFADNHRQGGASDSYKASITECAGKANAEEDECAVGGAYHKCMREKYPRHKH